MMVASRHLQFGVIIIGELITLLQLHVTESRTMSFLESPPFQMITFNILWKDISVSGRRWHSQFEKIDSHSNRGSRSRRGGHQSRHNEALHILKKLLGPLVTNVSMYALFREIFPKGRVFGLNSGYVAFFFSEMERMCALQKNCITEHTAHTRKEYS